VLVTADLISVVESAATPGLREELPGAVGVGSDLGVLLGEAYFDLGGSDLGSLFAGAGLEELGELYFGFDGAAGSALGGEDEEGELYLGFEGALGLAEGGELGGFAELLGGREGLELGGREVGTGRRTGTARGWWPGLNSNYCRSFAHSRNHSSREKPQQRREPTIYCEPSENPFKICPNFPNKSSR
jgi:hypothetical protein